MTVPQTEPLLPRHASITVIDDESRSVILPPLPPSIVHDGTLMYYMVWTWRLVIFSATGGTSLRLCNMILQQGLGITVARIGWILYGLLVSILELLFVYPFTLFIIGTIGCQRRFYGRVIYKGWGTWLLPWSVQKRWILSNWL
ncbi:uncharacterized protein BX664DRAFT_342275 [Halteromyces radiatus]|uniref:uncharacterized protein n=1 Tax=Halteromyces radiatus TaxID=101107 RepID=UPI00221FB1B4|nr:uncharacterized protein BX664DRAFT_342275 [Halteromyces radiatus]KAI8080077.1 hypothetical protein BX664DRAFT_342275 [Halteromyces radiatus]